MSGRPPLTQVAQTRSRNGLAVQPAGPAPSRTVVLDRGAFDADLLVPRDDQTLGLLVLEGLIVVQLDAIRSRVACLIGAGDLLRPWDLTEIALDRNVCWRVLTAVRAQRLAAEADRSVVHPRLVRALLLRATRTTRWLLAQALVLGAPRVEDRLLMSFSLWGERWGRVTPRGIWVDLPLTHELIAQLVGARRPTVTLAMGSLAAQELLTRHPRSGWLLDRPTYQLNAVTDAYAADADRDPASMG